ncbi:hypothetical protein lerEdw1_004862 [Lerista edwardsae]|nr:hypothetical protein lerEdw1_004862 [Lerista edwardsae]
MKMDPASPLGQPAAAGMDSVLLLLLFLAAIGTRADLDIIPYSPRISEKDLKGKVTGSTFALEPPNCVFDSFANGSDSIWLVVTLTNATASFKPPANPQQIPPYEDLYTRYGYMTMKSTISQYPCNKGKPGNVLRVGNESACKNDDTRTNCNGPLPSPGSYR